MKQTISAWLIWVLALMATCANRPAYAQLRLSGQARVATSAYETDTSTKALASVVALIREQETIWLNAMLWEQRAAFTEGAVCLRIKRAIPPDGFEVDSIERATLTPNTKPEWAKIWFTCPDGTAPLHMHIITADDTSWLRSRGDSTMLTWRKRCTPSKADADTAWSKYPFNAMMCGVGLDSIYAYRVRR